VIPVCAFVTFETAKGLQTCLKRMGPKSRECCQKMDSENYNHQIFGVHPKVTKAPDPSQIIWENYSISDNAQRWRRVLASVFITLVIVVLYCLIIKFSFKSSKFE